MTDWVEPIATGRNGERPTIRGEVRRSGEVFSPAVSPTDERTWTLSRWGIFAFALADMSEVSDVNVGAAACAAMVVLALESGWGVHEYRWNAAGIGCAGAALCMRFPPGRGDATLRAYTDLAAAARDFWRLVLRNATDAEWALILRGDLSGWAGLWRRGDWSPGDNDGDAMNEILTRVVANLRAGGVAAARLEAVRPLPAGTSLARVSGRGGGSGRDPSSPAPVRRRRKGLGLMVAGAVGALWILGRGR